MDLSLIGALMGIRVHHLESTELYECTSSPTASGKGELKPGSERLAAQDRPEA